MTGTIARNTYGPLLSGDLNGRAHPTGWAQFGLAPGAGPQRVLLHGMLAVLVERLLADGRIDEVFYLYKAPGLRIRMHETPGRTGVRDRVAGAVACWQRDGLVTSWQHGVYEPEELLFGGPDSLRAVHRAFTADTRVWLPVHAGRAGPPWAVALLLTRSLLDALQILGWERMDVADRLRRQTGRFADADLLAAPQAREVLATMGRAWDEPTTLAAALPPATRAALDTYAATVAEVFEDWRRDYLHTGHAVVGPRELAAFMSIFQWNRAGLSSTQQNLMTAVLARRPGSDR